MEITDLLQKVYDLEGMLHVKNRLGEGAPKIVDDGIARVADEVQTMAHRLLERPVHEEPATEIAITGQEPTQPEPEPTASAIQAEPEPEHEVAEPNDADKDEEDVILPIDDEELPRRDDDEPHEVFTFSYSEPQKRMEPPKPAETEAATAQTAEPIAAEPVATGPVKAVSELRRSFTINDRFRFRRALFHGSDDEMNRALALVEQMQSVHEAEEYFYDELGWDSEDPDAAYFMEIISRHFKR